MNLKTIEQVIQDNSAVMLYFSAPTCNVCHALKPKLLEAMKTNFDGFKIVSIDISVEQEIAAHYSVFTIPTVLVFLGGKEFLRKSRHMSIEEVVREIKRPYEILIS